MSIARSFIKTLLLACSLGLAQPSASASNMAAEVTSKDKLAAAGFYEFIERAASGQLPLEAQDSDGRPALITAIIFGTPAQVQRLLEQGHDANVAFLSIPAIFFTVSDQCAAEKLNLLIKAGATINLHEGMGGSFPIHSAAQHEDTRCLDALLQKGANPNAVDALGRTAYFYAIDFANKNAIQKLWEAEANPMLKARDGLDPFHYAIMSEKKDLIVDLLPLHFEEK